MNQTKFRLRRVLAIGALAVLAAVAMAPAGAVANPVPAPAGAVVGDAGPTGDVGTQHQGQVLFHGFGCQYIGRSGSSASGEFAATGIVSGSSCPRSMVRAYVCRSGSCYSGPWVTRSGTASWYPPSGYRVVESYHKCEGCVLTHTISH